MDFRELGVTSSLIKALDRLGFTEPTEIQKEVIPLAIARKDVLGCAQTGSGKTLAFGLPILHHMYQDRAIK